MFEIYFEVLYPFWSHKSLRCRKCTLQVRASEEDRMFTKDDHEPACVIATLLDFSNIDLLNTEHNFLGINITLVFNQTDSSQD